MIDEASQVLNNYFGFKSFRPGQDLIIKNILSKKDTLGILPTGGGKSLCYQIPALLFDGITIVVSPLISLMKDQVDALNLNGIKAAFINSSLNQKDLFLTYSDLKDNKYKIIYVAPERLLSETFLNIIKNINISFIAIDESHCVSQWGHDFRQSYLQIPEFIKKLNFKPNIAAFTATATPDVKIDIIKKLQLKNPDVFISSFDRPNLYFSVKKDIDNKKFILNYVKKHINSSGIIYASTRKSVELIYSMLKHEGYSVGKYHAGMTDEQKKLFQEEFIYEKINIMVATNAFGMGIDKSNVRYVIHNNLTKDIESYYQEAGRSGRDGDKSECILLFNSQDIILQRYFIDKSRNEVNEDVINVKYEKLNKIINYSNTSKCYRNYILKYFGESDVIDNCENCENCNSISNLKDITIEAQKILSCIAKLDNKFGKTMISNILKGSKSKKIIDYNFDKLSTYGILSDYTVKEIKNMINLFISDNNLEVSDGEYPVLKLNSNSWEILKMNKKVFMREQEEEKKVDISIVKKNDIDDDKINIQLFNTLKEFRLNLSKQRKVPPYVIFHDATLTELSKYLPITFDEMLEIKGIGKKKIEKYGNHILEIIKKFKQK